MRQFTKLGNATFLAVLAVNLLMPLGWLRPSSAESPSLAPIATGVDTGPLAGDFLSETLIATHETLFGPAEVGWHTVLYSMDTPISGPGVYFGRNNVGQTFWIHVIRDQQLDHAAALVAGLPDSESDSPLTIPHLIWGTMATAAGATNVIAVYSTLSHDGSNSNSPDSAARAIMPIITHDTYLDEFVPDDLGPASDDIQFAEMSEEDQAAGLCNPSLKFRACPSCGNGTVWCPCNDPAVEAALDELKLCLAQAAVDLAERLLTVWVAFYAAMEICGILVLEPPAMWICLTIAGAIFVHGGRTALVIAGIEIAHCWYVYQEKVQQAMQSACGRS